MIDTEWLEIITDEQQLSLKLDSTSYLKIKRGKSDQSVFSKQEFDNTFIVFSSKLYPKISREQAEIVPHKFMGSSVANWVIRDGSVIKGKPSTNGTFVNGRCLSEGEIHPLQHLDKITFAETENPSIVFYSPVIVTETEEEYPTLQHEYERD